MPKINIPMGLDGDLDLTDESKQLSTLIYNTQKTTEGLGIYESLSSGIVYSTDDYPDDPLIYNKGESGLIHIWWKLYGGEDGFLLLAKDANEYIRPAREAIVVGDVVGFDADTLDGKEPEYYLDYNNLVNTPLPDPPKVASVFGREGDIVAQTGDYTPEQVGAAPAAHANNKNNPHEVTTGQIGAATTATYTTSLSYNWSGSGPYTQTVAVEGILETDNPIVDVILSTNSDIAKKEKENWLMVDKIITNNNSITATCLYNKPMEIIQIQLKVVR